MKNDLKSNYYMMHFKPSLASQPLPTTMWGKGLVSIVYQSHFAGIY